MAFLWVHSRLGGWRESAGGLDYCAAYIHSAPRASGGGTISKADTFPGLRPETECSVHEGAIASSRRKRMVSVNQARSFLASCGILGICCAALLVAHASSPAAGNLKPESNSRAVAITVDDLPGAVPARGSWAAVGDLKDFEKINRAIPRILKSHHAPAIGFVNEWKLQVSGERDARVALLQWWLDAGLTLGNHTSTHASFQTTPLDQYEDETIRGEVVTRALMKAAGQEEKYFRHPFLMTGTTQEVKVAFEAFLKERGYRVAPVTVDNDDWRFNDVLGAA